MMSRMGIEQQLECGVRIRVSYIVRMWESQPEIYAVGA